MHSLPDLGQQPLVVLLLRLHGVVHQQAPLLHILGQGQLVDVDELSLIFTFLGTRGLGQRQVELQGTWACMQTRGQKRVGYR